MTRVNLGKANPDLYSTIAELDKKVSKNLFDSGIEEGFSHLLRLRASQINQCAFCIRLHTQDALKCKESIERISLLAAWRETQYFSEEERCALSLVEEITLISTAQLPDDVYEQASNYLTEAQIAAVEWLAITINAWNRIAISSRYTVQP